jgi:hypothetical protein
VGVHAREENDVGACDHGGIFRFLQVCSKADQRSRIVLIFIVEIVTATPLARPPRIIPSTVGRRQTQKSEKWLLVSVFVWL